MVSVELVKEHGYVMLVVAGTFALNLWQMIKVGGARKKFNVLYPKMYSEDKEHFNCYQRAHQNYLENVPLFLALLFLSSLFMPLYSAGLVYKLFYVEYWCFLRFMIQF